jgi:hypothetical protein
MAPTPAGDPVAGREDHHTAPRGDRTEATLAFTRGASDIHIHPEQVAARLFTARFYRPPAHGVGGPWHGQRWVPGGVELP